MTDTEINEAVARKLGWTFTPIPKHHVSYDRPMPWTTKDGRPRFDCPDYCHSIEAAWEIVEKFDWFCLNHDKEGGWSVWDMAGTEEAECFSKADTAPMAIALAFLKLGDV